MLVAVLDHVSVDHEVLGEAVDHGHDVAGVSAGVANLDLHHPELVHPRGEHGELLVGVGEDPLLDPEFEGQVVAAASLATSEKPARG